MRLVEGPVYPPQGHLQALEVGPNWRVVIESVVLRQMEPNGVENHPDPTGQVLHVVRFPVANRRHPVGRVARDLDEVVQRFANRLGVQVVDWGKGNGKRHGGGAPLGPGRLGRPSGWSTRSTGQANAVGRPRRRSLPSFYPPNSHKRTWFATASNRSSLIRSRYTEAMSSRAWPMMASTATCSFASPPIVSNVCHSA